MQTHAILLLAAGLTLAACDDPVGPTSGTLRVSTYTEGGAPGQAGYRLAVDNADSLELTPTGTVEIDLTPGRHTLRLVGVAEACSVTPGASLDIDITRGHTTSVAFEITCPLTGNGTLVVSTATTGDDADQDGYLLAIDDADSVALQPNGTVRVELAAGRHTLRLLGVLEPCLVVPDTSLEVDITPQGTTRVAFGINCPVTGARVTVTTTGLDLDRDGYRVVVEGTDSGIVPVNSATTFGLQPGSRTIALTDLAANCAVEGSGSATVTIVDREIAPVEFAVVCTAVSGVIGVSIQGAGPGAVFDASVDGATPVRVTSRVYVTGISAGPHVISLIAPVNCSVETESQSVTVTAGGLVRDTVEVTFSATCVSGFRVTAPTTGPIPPGRYTVWLCRDRVSCVYGFPYAIGRVAPNDTLFAPVDPGSYWLALYDVPRNCRVTGTNPVGGGTTSGITLQAGQLASVSFPVQCT